MDGAIFQALEPESVETRALCPIVPRGRREPRPKNMVSIPNPLRGFMRELAELRAAATAPVEGFGTPAVDS